MRKHFKVILLLRMNKLFVNPKILTIQYALHNIKQQNNQNKYSTKIKNYENIFNC